MIKSSAFNKDLKLSKRHILTIKSTTNSISFSFTALGLCANFKKSYRGGIQSEINFFQNKTNLNFFPSFF